jgi:hypothetical protein
MRAKSDRSSVGTPSVHVAWVVQAFMGPGLQSWDSAHLALNVAVQAFAARASVGKIAVVFVLPGKAVAGMVDIVKQESCRRFMGFFCTCSAFRHMETSDLLKLAQHCTVRCCACLWEGPMPGFAAAINQACGT